MQPARTELFWPRQLVRKWLQFKPTGDDFNADNVEHDSIMADEEEEEERETVDAELPTSLSGLNIIEPQAVSKPPRPLIRGQSETLRKQYVETKEYRIAVGTWNVAGKPPPEDLDLDEWIESCQEADIYVLGFQEIVPLNAGNVLCVEDDAPAAKWERLIRNCLNSRYPSYRQKSQSAPHSPWSDTNVAVNSELYIDDIIEGIASEDALCSLLESSGSTATTTATATATPAPASGLPSFQEGKEEAPKRPAHWTKRYRLTARERFSSGRRFSADGFDAIFKPDERRLLDSSHSRDKGVPSSGGGIRSSLTGGRRLSLDGSSLPGPGEGYHSFLDQDESLEAPLFAPGSDGHPFSHQSGHSRSRYTRVASKQMVGIFISVWVRTELRRYVHNVKVSCVGCGLMRYLGNKGSVSISMSLHQTSLCFICSHLTSGHKEGDELRRNQDVSEILRRTVFPRSSKLLQLPENIMSHDCIIWLGDLNYRIAMPDHEARKLIAREDWESLLEKDQLKLEQNGGRVFDGWQEGPIYFPPTYKYEFNSDQYSGENTKPGEKRRTPAWCDRILYLGKALRELSYVRTESRLSDHRPVSAVFLAEVERLSRHKLKRAVTFAQPVNTIHTEDISPHLSSLRGLHKVPNPEIDVPSLADVGNPHPIAKLTVSQSFKHKLRRERSLPPTGCMKVGDADMEISSHGFAHPKMANTLPVF